MITAAQIDPKLNPAYSPNLHAFVRSKVDSIQVFRVSRNYGVLRVGMLAIGYIHDGHFVGCLLNSALCHGRKARTWCFAGHADGVELIPEFWERYLKVGRCAIDPDHTTLYIDERWTHVTDDKRRCLWCGHEQHRVLTPVTKMVESWHDEPPATPEQTTRHGAPCWYCNGKGEYQGHPCPACSGGQL